MLDVYFESNKEVTHFCESVFYYNKKIELQWTTHKEWGNHLKFKDPIHISNMGDILVKSIVDVFVQHRLGAIITNIIKENYYYENDAETERILEITLWILTGDDGESTRIRKNIDFIEMLGESFTSHIKDAPNHSAIHFDSLVKFRLQLFKEKLLDIVGLAIDEYKREEDHQAFIETLREYIGHKASLHEEIHVLQANPFIFFKANGRRFTNIELRTLIKKEPLYMFGLTEDEWNLAPIIAMAPDQIFIYGNDPAEPKTLTVINVFQEKAVFLTKESFPFPSFLNNS